MDLRHEEGMRNSADRRPVQLHGVRVTAKSQQLLLRCITAMQPAEAVHVNTAVAVLRLDVELSPQDQQPSRNPTLMLQVTSPTHQKQHASLPEPLLLRA
jgi:hypothetical protein